MGILRRVLLGGSVILIAGTLLFFWLPVPVSDQELLANFAKAGDFWRGMGSVGGWPWWTPQFLQGTSLALAWGVMLTNVAMIACSLPLGFLAGSKVAVVACLLAGAAGMFYFLRRWAGAGISAWLGASLFLLCPSVLTRAVGFEHFVVVVSLAVLPWVLWALVGLMRAGTLRAAVAAGVCFSALVLAYGKTGAMALPALVAFGVAEYFARPRGARPGWRVFALAAGVVVLLAVVPNLPALREAGFVAMFDFGPFEGWQRAFSSKSALSWFDRGGVLGAGMEPGFAPTTLNGGTYLGFVLAGVMVVALLRGTLRDTPTGRKARVLLALALGTFWLSFGPRSVLGGHFEFLRMSAGAADFTPAIAWFLLAAQVWVIFQLVPSGVARWQWAAAGLALVYVFVPGFRLLEYVPLYRNIRAPFDFFQITGAVCVVGAAALAAGALLANVRWNWLRRGLAAALVLLAAADASVYARPFFSQRLEQAVWEDFLAAQAFLTSAPEPGRVYAFSGRYFYLMTPWLSGRPLAAEAFNSYLQQRGAAVLQGSAFLNDAQLTAYFRVAGVAYLLIDKSDPDTAPNLQERLRGKFGVVFENANMAVLGVTDSLGYGFLAQDIIQTSGDGPETAIPALGGAEHRLAMIRLDGVATDEPGLRGKVADGRIVAREGQVMQEGRAFERVARRPEGNYQQVVFDPPGKAGWLVFNEAWHPDWRASANGVALPVRRALLAFSAVKTDGTEPVTFEFREPWWYNWCAWSAIAGWIVAVGFLTMARAIKLVKL
jgi:hypothetical protein